MDGANHLGAGTFECAKAREIEVVHMRVREENKIDGRQALRQQGNVNEAFDADGQGSNRYADAGTKYWISENGKAIDLKQHCAVA